jgi:uncharacterized protein
MIAGTITQKIGEAMKAHDELRLSTLRMLSSAFNYEKIAKQHELTEEEELVVIRKEAKKRTDAIESLRLAQGKLTQNPGSIAGRIEQEETELSVLKEFLPKEIEESELSDLVNQAIEETGAKELRDMGKVIGLVVSKSGGRVDGGRVSVMVKKALVIRQ